MRYIPYVPRSIPKGRVLAHNPVQAICVDQAPGVNGFRAFTFAAHAGDAADDLPSNFVPCDCGWSGLPHYRPPTRMGRPWRPRSDQTNRKAARPWPHQRNPRSAQNL